MNNSVKNHVHIPTFDERLPIEITIVGKFPKGTGKTFVDAAFIKQATHSNYVEEYCEQSALIGKTNFAKDDPTAIYTFGVDHRDVLFHRHVGHRVIIGITGSKGSIIRFSLATPEEVKQRPQHFIDKMYTVNIAADCMFALRFNGTIYHQFGPADSSEQGFFAVTVHTNEAYGLDGKLLTKVLNNEGTIPLLTEPAPTEVMKLLQQPGVYHAVPTINLDFV
ncbi:hypothetical protein AYO45_00240 [Gammaproteobacteria bacterium SCGC AG-212-F23]|nr:hypothetical protein AYO45_00240 [Gammaproteobacteria bacterium SCGC AG-212-F23]